MTSPSNPDTRSDEAVFEAYRDGDAEGLGTLVRRYHDDLLRFLVRLVGDRAGAEDVFQETFLQIHLSADSFDASRRFKPWLFTIAANKARDHLRRTSRRRMLNLSAPLSSGSGGGTPDDGTTFVDLLEVEVPKPGDAADTAEREAMVQRAVTELPLSLREVLLLAYFQRLSYAEIAETLEIPLGTVKSRLHAAVAAFARKWQAISREESPKSEGGQPTP